MKQRGNLTVEFVPKTPKRLDYNPFFSDPSLINEIKNRMDQELRNKGINVKSSTIEPDPKTFGIKYQAEYDPPRRYGVAGAIVAAVKAVIRAVVQAIKAIARLIVRAIKAVVKFIQKLIVRIQTLIQYLDKAFKRWKPLVEGRQSGEIDPNNPEKDLDKIEKDVDREGGGKSSTLNIGSPWIILGALGLAGIVLMRMKK